MIETWRQCVSAFWPTKGETVPSYFVVGPFRGGGYIRELRFALCGERATLTMFSAAVSATDQATLEALLAGSPVVSRSRLTDEGFGVPFWVGVPNSVAGDLVIPMWRLVDTGARYIVVGVNPLVPQEVYTLATVTVVGVARMGANGMGVEDGIGR